MRRVWGVVLLVLAVAMTYAVTTTAQDLFDGLDVLLVVDQSGSMRGYATCLDNPRLARANDPTGIRFEIQQVLMQWLGDYSFYVSPDTAIRLSAIAFGSPQRTPTLDWIEVPSQRALSGRDESLWKREYGDLNVLLSQATFGSRDFCDTDFVRAFQLAKDQFDTIPLLADGKRRLKVIIIITDGRPCVPGEMDCNSVSEGERHLNALKNYASLAFPEPNYQIFLVALDPDGATGSGYWGDLGGIWESITTPPRAQVVSDSGQINTAVNNIVKQLFDSVGSGLDSTDITTDLRDDGRATVFVYPYRTYMQVNVFKEKIDDTTGISTALQIIDPDGNTITGGSPRVSINETGSMQIWKILTPKAGEWVFLSNTPDSVSVVVDQADMRYDLLGIGSTYYRWQPVPIAPYLKYLVGESTGEEPVSLLSDRFALTVQADIQAPSGKNTLITLATGVPIQPSADFGGKSPQLAGIYYPREVGTYSARLCGFVSALTPSDPSKVTCNPSVFTPLDTVSAPDTFTVNEINVVVEADERLLERPGYTWFTELPLSVCVIIQDPRTGQRVPNYDPERLSFSVLANDGSTTSETVFPLVYQADLGERCTFKGEVTPMTPGSVRLSAVGSLLNTDTGALDEVYRKPEFIVMNVSPLQRIKLRALEPSTPDATSDFIHPLYFWQQQPLRVSVVSEDEAGNLINLVNTTGKEKPVRLQVFSAGNDVTGGSELRQIDDGSTFTLETNAYSVGGYNVSVQGEPLDVLSCGCDYTADGNTLALNITRQVPPQAFLTVGGLVLFVLVTGGMLIYAILREWGHRQYPLNGSLELQRDTILNAKGKRTTSYESTLSLDNGRDTIKIKANAIPADWHIKEMEVTNRPPTTEGADYKATWEQWRAAGKVRVKITPTKDAPSTMARVFDIEPPKTPQDRQLLFTSADGQEEFYISREAETTDDNSTFLED